MNGIPCLSLEPTEEMRKAFDSFLQHDFSEFSRPKFESEAARDAAIRCWWRAEISRRHAVAKISNFRSAFYDLTGIG